jgi:hypothetical protein
MIGRGVRALSESIVTPFGVRQYYTRMYDGTDVQSYEKNSSFVSIPY